MLHRRTILKSGVAGLMLWNGRGWASSDTDPDLIVHGRVPHNAEPPLGKLVKSFVTPNPLFYVRSHAPVPEVDVEAFRLSIEGMVDRPYELSLQQVKNDFARQDVMATMTCAGNRRNEHSAVKQVSGVPWGPGAIGNAEWGGALLSDLLKKAGIKEGAKHVWFEGVDQIERSDGVIPFGASIPISKAMDADTSMPCALVAYEMNGEALPPDHGYPLRTVVPGYIGARSVKWLGKIVVSDRPSPNHYVAHAYKLVTEDEDNQWSQASPLETYVLNSVICTPSRDARVEAGKVNVSGYALPPGKKGMMLRSVEVSADGGKSWTKASFTSPARPFCWRLWKAEVPVTLKTTSLAVRATDSSGRSQPKTIPWNLKGYMFNAWYTSSVDVT